ncbi:helix-turn-helix domain-containing protein [Rhodobacteraceae bacterium M385]|nr:helix-turn-helix domain-containing protein [Rhodobacteraceae bacterium M385]
MSHRANCWLAQLAPARVKPGAFRVLFHLCDHHNGERDPRRACFPSQKTLRERTGMANGTLNAALAKLEADGLIQRIRSTVPGHTTRRTYYILECDFDGLEGQTPKPGVSANSDAPELAQEQTPVSERANSGLEAGKLRSTGEEPERNRKEEDMCTVGSACDTHPTFAEFWQIYPRRRDRVESERRYAEAVADGTDPAKIISGARAYADENASNGKQFIAYSANWLKNKRWRDYAVEVEPVAKTSDLATLYAERIKAGMRIFGSPVSEELRAELITEHGLTNEQIDRAYVAV